MASITSTDKHSIEYRGIKWQLTEEELSRSRVIKDRLNLLTLEGKKDKPINFTFNNKTYWEIYYLVKALKKK